MRFYIFLCFCITFTSGLKVFALSCQKEPVQLIFECKSGICSEAFFGFHKLSGHHCRSVWNVNSEDKIYKISESKKIFNDKPNGVYSATFEDRFGIKSIEQLEYNDCLKLDDSNQILILCNP